MALFMTNYYRLHIARFRSPLFICLSLALLSSFISSTPALADTKGAPKNSPTSKKSLSLNEQGVDAVNKKDSASAEMLFKQALDVDHQNLSAAFNLAAVYLLNKKPIVHYGSSITQGGCASRPGMAYTNILARWLDRSVYNLGFSGEGTFEESVGQAICEMDVAMVIIDCNPNSDTSIIYQRAIDLVRQVRKCRPNTPILLLENYIYPDDAIFPENTPVCRDSKNKLQHRKWQKLSAAYDVLKKEKIKNLYYQKGDHLIGDDIKSIVDESHSTDHRM